MPSYLIRTSDMKVIQGTAVDEGYCALSYSWNQSGEILKNETSKKKRPGRIDEGKHKIIFPGKTVRKKPRGRRRIPRKVKFVTFEGLIQEICKDFNIKYIWCDQMCIDQNDKEKKYREISQMHKIYRNAYCTIALVPELTTVAYNRYPGRPLTLTHMDRGILHEAQWMKRMWTLQETLMSSKLLLIGSNTHCWWYQLLDCKIPFSEKEFDHDVARVLHYAHARASTREHDRIFALANLFPDTMKEIKIDYNQDIQELMIQFYGLLARKDLSILCFGPYTFSGYMAMCKTSSSNSIIGDGMENAEYNVPIQNFDLPSWTGVDGEHYEYEDYKTLFKKYTVSGRILKITCCGMTNDQHHTENLGCEPFSAEDIPPLPQQKSNGDYDCTLVARIRLPGFINEKFIGVYMTHIEEDKLDTGTHEDIIEKFQSLSHFMSIKKNSLQWISESSEVPITWFSFDDLAKTLQSSAQYVLLAGVRYTTSYRTIVGRYPIIKKDGSYYKAIGMCSIENDEHFFDGMTMEEQMFEIH